MPHVSPSQVGRKRLCFRWWAYDRQRPRSPEKPAAAFGSRGHTVAENWLQFGTPPPATPEGRCMLAGLEWLPLPQDKNKVVEHRFDVTIGGVDYTGRIDLLYGYDPGRIVMVCDHKTTGDLKHMMTLDGMVDGEYDYEKDFRTDPQRVIYSHWAANHFNVDWVGAHWQYYRRKPPKSLPLVMVEHRNEIARKFWTLHHEDSLPIIQAAGLPPEAFPRTLTACNAFGGCPHREECHVGVSPLDIAAATLSR